MNFQFRIVRFYIRVDEDEEKSVKASTSSSENVRNFNHTRKDLDAAIEELKQIEETLNNK